MSYRILFDCERLKYQHTGLFTFCENLGKALLENAPSNLAMEYYVPANQVGIFGDSVKYHVQKPWHKLIVPGSRSLDLWHSSNQVSRYGPSSSKVKIVLTIHDLNFLIEKQSQPAKVSRNLKKIQQRINKASAIVCISNYVAAEVEKHFDLGGKEISVIYNGCTIDEYPEFSSPEYRPVKPFLFTIGTVLPKKNFHVLPALLKDNDLELIIAGNLSSEAYVSKILEEAQKLNVASRVKILGPISDPERYWYYKNALAFVFPSIAEGFGLPVIEAMHYGKPVFLSNLTSLPEIGGDAAYYFENFEPQHMQDVLKEGLENFSQGIMTRKAMERAKLFTWKQTANSYLDLYLKLL